MLGWLLIFVGIPVAGSFAYLVWRVLDRHEVGALQSRMDLLERRLTALEDASAGTTRQ